MMTQHDTDNTARRFSPGLIGRIGGRLGWALLGAAVAVLLFFDPWDMHSVDAWIHGLAHRHEDVGAEAAQAETNLWTCGMHPQVVQSEPGQCPICGMDLVPVAAAEVPTATTTPAATTGEREILFYRNPMNPTITSPVPMKDEMGMDYAPVYLDEVESAASQGAIVTINPVVVQNMNVQIEPVRRRDIARQIRTVGYLEYDQQKMVSVTTKYSGWIEKVYVNYVGEPVRKGQPLFEIYSPELVQTEQELLSALQFARRMENAPEDPRRRAESLVQAARTRLAYWDITSEQIDRLERTGEVFRTLTVTAPAGGVVMKRMPGLEGMAAKPGMQLFHIADLSSLWLSVEVFEDQLAWLREGSMGEISLSYFPGETFTGRVRFIEPQVSEATRTVPLKLEVPNPKGRLRSGMYATVVFRPQAARDAITVPSQAVLRTGERDVVIVALGEGRFAPREVSLGAAGEGYMEVLSGLGPDERVVTSAQFLIDSESNLRAAIQKMMAKRTGQQGENHAH
jgi:RND family efflux transporter MFP subunit